jgi:hypothetical protein
MSAARILYRTRQFWQILRFAPTERELDGARTVLTPAQLDLFSRMQPGEQFHSLEVYSKLVESGENNPDLLAAALLHDAGKTHYPLKLWERIWIVIGNALLPHLVQQWSKANISGPKRAAFWKRPFIVAEHHPAWGAELAFQAGSSPRTISLIHRHQESLEEHLQMGTPEERVESDSIQFEIQDLEDRMLYKLQKADNES